MAHGTGHYGQETGELKSSLSVPKLSVALTSLVSLKSAHYGQPGPTEGLFPPVSVTVMFLLLLQMRVVLHSAIFIHVREVGNFSFKGQ